MAWIPVSPCNLPASAIDEPNAKVARAPKSPLPCRPIARLLGMRVDNDRQCEALGDSLDSNVSSNLSGSLALSMLPLASLGHLSQTKPVSRQFKPCLFV